MDIFEYSDIPFLNTFTVILTFNGHIRIVFVCNAFFYSDNSVTVTIFQGTKFLLNKHSGYSDKNSDIVTKFVGSM